MPGDIWDLNEWHAHLRLRPNKKQTLRIKKDQLKHAAGLRDHFIIVGSMIRMVGHFTASYRLFSIVILLRSTPGGTRGERSEWIPLNGNYGSLLIILIESYTTTIPYYTRLD